MYVIKSVVYRSIGGEIYIHQLEEELRRIGVYWDR